MNNIKTAPCVSVITIVYNGARFLQAAIDSILGQTFTDFEYVIVDDGSTDETPAILSQYADPRIVLVRHAANKGVITSRNDALAVAKGDYIANLDADDVAYPQRLEKQVAFLRAHPQVGLVGSWVEQISQEGTPCGQLHPPTDHRSIVDACVGENPFTHSSIMFERQAALALGGYPVAYEWGEDFALCMEISRVRQVANLDEVLVQLRLHPDQHSHWSRRLGLRKRGWVDLRKLALEHPQLSAPARHQGRRALAHAYLDYAVYLTTDGTRQDALKQLALAVLTSPGAVLGKENRRNFARTLSICFGFRRST